MAESFNPELFFKRCDREIIKDFIESNKINWQLNWDEKPQKFARDLFTQYALDPNRADLETALCEIHDTAQNAGTVQKLIEVAQQEGLDTPDDPNKMTAHNLALWLYTHAQDKWAKIVRFIYADRLTTSMWFITELDDAPDDPEWTRPEIKELEEAIARYMYVHELRGEHVEIIYEQRDENTEYFFVYFNDYRITKSTYTDDDGFRHDSINTDAKTLIFHIQHDQNRIRARIEKEVQKRKKDLCELVASKMLNRHIKGLTKNAPVYDLSAFLNPVQGDLFYDLDGSLTVDDDGDIVAARVSEIGVKIPGTQAAFSVKEDQGKIYVLLREKLDKTDLFKAGQEVDYVVIKLQLNDSFGRSQRQTLRLTANSTSNGSRNSRVAELIDKTLKRWHIDPQA